MGRRFTRCGWARKPDGPADTNDTTHESRHGHSTRIGVLRHVKGIWPWDLNRMLDDDFGWSLPLRLAAIRSWPRNWSVF